MPIMINGFGTWYIGRRNVHSALDRCDQCGTLNTLKSYDTRRFLMALYIPLIPAGRFRVLNHCGRCDKFRVTKLTAWNKLKAEMREQVLAAAQQQLGSDDAVKQILHPIMGFQDRDTLAAVAATLRSRYEGDAYFLMHLGNAYSYFNYQLEAEEAYNASMEVEDSQECREHLAWVKLLQERPDEAWPLLEHLLITRNRERYGMLFHLAVSYQALGRHQDALNIIDEVFAAFPETKTEKDWLKLQRASQKNLASGKPIRMGSLSQAYRPAKQRTARWAYVLGPIAIAVLLGAYLYACFYTAENRTIYAVSGLAAPYEFQFDGTPMKLAANGTRPIQTAEGTHRFSVEALGVPEESFELHTNFFLRPFQPNEVFVLNPDKVAVLMEENMEYMENVDDSAKYSYTLSTNNAYYRFHRIHFPFQEFPEQVQIANAREMRRRVSAATIASSADAINLLAGQVDDEALQTHLRRRFHYTPEDPMCSQFLVSIMGFDAFATEIQPELARRPVLIEVHRVYQSSADTLDPDRDLEKEYAELLAKEPENGDLIYLLARATRDLDQADSLFRKAAAPPYNCPYAVAAMAFDSLSRGESAEAKSQFDSISAESLGSFSYERLQSQIRIALRDYDALLADVAHDVEGAPVSDSDAMLDVHYRTLRKDPDAEIDASVNAFCAKIELAGADKNAIRETRRAFDTIRAFASGDRDRYFALLETDTNPEARFQAALHHGDLELASNMVETGDFADEGCHLVLYILAAKAGRADLAETHLKKGAELLGSGAYEDRTYAAMLLGNEPFDLNRAQRLSVLPETKRVLLAALAIRFPDAAAELNSLARTLNYHVSFPYYELRDALAE
ncbi:MAG: hypothetical protein IT365_14340 [Candidatus Hydrogenedentes bacterium]|nr:hypothetical protein [Candidatus Hydrogenedentota bacterium]